MIRIICVGKLKENYLKELVKDYFDRLNKYHKTEIIEVKDSDIAKESLEIEKYIDKKDFIITLEIDGKQMNSIEFAKNIDNWIINYSKITFIIGGSEGLHEAIKQRSNYSLSFSDMTFPHGLFRGFLIEQIYRSFKIMNHETYHK